MFYKTFYIVLALISILSGFFLFFNQIIFVGFFLIIIPPLIVYFLVFRKTFGKWVRYLILPSLTFLIVIFTVFAIIIESISQSFNPINAIWRYEGVLKSFGIDEYVSHFPKKVHKNADNVKFSFAPQFLQGGGHLILKEEFNEEDFQKLSKYFKDNKNTEIILPDFSFDHFPIIYVIGEDTKNYEIVGIQSKPYKNNDWNHGRASGVALQDANNSIIYWYEFW